MIDKAMTGFFFVASLFLFAAHVDASPAESAAAPVLTEVPSR